MLNVSHVECQKYAHYGECLHAEGQHAECLDTECHYTECRCAECGGAKERA